MMVDQREQVENMLLVNPNAPKCSSHGVPETKYPSRFQNFLGETPHTPLAEGGHFPPPSVFLLSPPVYSLIYYVTTRSLIKAYPGKISPV